MSRHNYQVNQNLGSQRIRGNESSLKTLVIGIMAFTGVTGIAAYNSIDSHIMNPGTRTGIYIEKNLFGKNHEFCYKLINRKPIPGLGIDATVKQTNIPLDGTARKPLRYDISREIVYDWNTEILEEDKGELKNWNYYDMPLFVSCSNTPNTK